MNSLYTALTKIELPGLDHEYYYQRLTMFRENEWFIPTNSIDASDFQICFELCQWNLIQKKNEPVWVSGCFRGQRVYFRYNTELYYKKS